MILERVLIQSLKISPVNLNLIHVYSSKADADRDEMEMFSQYVDEVWKLRKNSQITKVLTKIGKRQGVKSLENYRSEERN